MRLEINKNDILDGLCRQLRSFYSLDGNEVGILDFLLDQVLTRCEKCFIGNPNKYYSLDGEVYFNPFHSGQYTVFLYYFSNTIFNKRKDNIRLASKVYYLNKIMNGCDLFYEVDLPEIFILDHPVGSVLGRAKFGDYFKFGQNCTVGNNRGIFPIIGDNVTMSAGSMILGKCNIGNNVILGAGACVKDQDVPANSLVFGSTPNLVIKTKKFK